MIKNACWITPKTGIESCPVFRRKFKLDNVKKATLYITAKGVYKAELNGERVGDFIMAPGWTKYDVRHQYQEYDITGMLKTENELCVTVGDGWQRGRLNTLYNKNYKMPPVALIASVVIEYVDGTTESIVTDEMWECGNGAILSSDIYDGEICDANLDYRDFDFVNILDETKENLIPQEGEKVIEQERIKPVSIITTPKGEMVVDFGQNITGYPEITVDANKGDIVDLSFAEVLDFDGNFYNSNYRTAKAEYKYICKDGKQTYKPSLAFYGFRYVRVNQFPKDITSDCFTAIAVYSDIKRTGNITFENSKLNQLFSNIIWSQKDNFLDVPTDCPQRDERLGWTGDAQVFVRAACYNFDTERFFKKWLKDLIAEQYESGAVSHVIPNALGIPETSTAWGDASVIVPWQVYLAYGNKEILERSFDSMCKWISYITNTTKDKYLWTGSWHFGDWLGLDAEEGSYKGSSDQDLIASAFYAYSTSIVVKTGKIIGKDVSYYEDLYKNIKQAFKNRFNEFKTQTECVLVLYFGLCNDSKKTAKQLDGMIKANGNKLTTGFVGTPYLLHALSENGYADTAYDLLLQEEYPSWLFSVKMGATTIWEHWDGLNETGKFWSDDMNSYNHYAYGSVADWMYSVAAGIKINENYPAYEKAIIAPIPDERLGGISCTLETRHGKISSSWKYKGGKARYFIETPVDTLIIIDGREYNVEKGKYIF